MLFQYTYVPHQMERMHRFINFIFLQIWCRAPKLGKFQLNLFDSNPPLKEVMTSFNYDHTVPGDRFYSQVEGIYHQFSKLSRKDIAQLKRWYQGNNDINKVCANDSSAKLARYADIAPFHKDLSEQLAAFFKGLYSHEFLNLAALRAVIGDIDDHYLKFVKINNKGKCPFCGINDLLGEYNSKRDAYDHYLPKAFYPFNSINFRNLVPTCHHCNSSYKTSKDPAYIPKDPVRAIKRRRFFNPYVAQPNAIQLKVSLAKANITKLTPTDVAIEFGPFEISEEIATWKDVYGIKERYKAKFCGPDARDWIEQFRIMNRRHKTTANEYISDIDDADEFANCNFLKKAFVMACKDTGLLSTLEKFI